MKYIEIEFKYSSENIKLTEFDAFCLERKPKKSFIASGYDHFYSNPKDAEGFLRHRTGPDANQLTYKRKTVEKNNFNREEQNLDFSKKMSQEDIAKHCSTFGYLYDSTLFKNCFIHLFDYYTLVYYICYDINMKELGRFVEIEMSEDYAWGSEQEAWDELITLEKLCKGLGISPQSRVKRSLFEMYGKQK